MAWIARDTTNVTCSEKIISLEFFCNPKNNVSSKFLFALFLEKSTAKNPPSTRGNGASSPTRARPTAPWPLVIPPAEGGPAKSFKTHRTLNQFVRSVDSNIKQLMYDSSRIFYQVSFIQSTLHSKFQYQNISSCHAKNSKLH